MLRRKIKQLADPTNLVRFPFRTTLHEHPTTYLAHKVCGGADGERMMTRRLSTPGTVPFALMPTRYLGGEREIIRSRCGRERPGSSLPHSFMVGSSAAGARAACCCVRT